MNTPDHDDDELGPSRSQRRRDALAVLALAEQLLAVPPSRLDQFELPGEVRAEIANVRGMRANGARKRQLAYLAKLMRRHDEAAFAPARAALGEDSASRHQEQAAMQRLEALREELLGEDGDAALTRLIDQHPAIDRQQLRTLIRRARGERESGKPPRAYRELFRNLRDIVEAGAD